MTKTVFITGATSGIGLHTALQLAQRGFRVLFSGRDEKKVQETLSALENLSPGRGHKGYIAELTLLREALRLAETLFGDTERIDVFISNAGAVFQSRTLTSEGLEATFALNHMAPFVIAQRLLPLLQAAAPARLIVVSSHSHYSGRLDFENIQGEKKYSALQQYANTKLMNVLFSNAFDRRFQQLGIRSNALHPGVVRTGIGYKNTNIAGKVAWWLFTRWKGIPAEAGAKTSVWLATEEEGIKDGGKYYSNCREKQPLPEALNPLKMDKLWEYSENIKQKILS
jgi:NAD(P)-dependent dehydrogenase (short-subunit alcohol dehydrogenase family)